jgi:hypothetical protein
VGITLGEDSILTGIDIIKLNAAEQLATVAERVVVGSS